MTLQNDKMLLRPSLRKTLFLLKPERKETASLDACFFLIKHLQNSHFKVLSFASSPFEINLWPLNRWLIKKNRLLLPKVEKKQLQIYEVNSLQDLKISSQGIQEPCPLHCKKVEIKGCNPLILVPALAFDRTHHRIGQGKGHYDKLLLLFPKSIKWGVGFHEQKCQSLPIEDHDLALDKVLFF